MCGAKSFVASGWIQKLLLLQYGCGKNLKYLVCGYVKPSQRVTENPHMPWYVVEQDGGILAAHCTCMAG